jgi:LytS/YehU family sensor histidine kinase
MFWFRTAPSAPPQRRLSPALAFHWILVGPFLVQVIIAIGLTAYFSVRNSQKSAENFAFQLQTDVGQRICQRLDSYLAMPHPGQITLTTQADTSQIQITIADNGNGIDPTLGDKIFDPFFTTKPIGQGVGLSLSIAYQVIVEQHGGTLRYESNVNEGSCFMIGIPLASRARVVTGRTTKG